LPASKADEQQTKPQEATYFEDQEFSMNIHRHPLLKPLIGFNRVAGYRRGCVQKSAERSVPLGKSVTGQLRHWCAGCGKRAPTVKKYSSNRLLAMYKI